MSAVAEPALNTTSPVADVIPESSKSGLPDGSIASVVDKFWDAPAEPAKPVVPATKDAVSADDAPPAVKTPPLTQSLGDKIAAKVKPVAVPVTPVAETAPEHPEDKLELGAKSSPEARENFAKLKAIAKERAGLVAAKDKELAELRSKASIPAALDTAELERLRKEHKDAMDRLLVIDTRNHPAFQNQYIKPRQDAIAAATELLKAHGKDADLASLIEKPRGEIGKALSEILKDVPAFDQTEISSNIQKAYQLAQAEKQALTQADQVNGAIRKKDSTAHVSAFEATWSKVSAAAGEFLVEADVPADAPVERRQRLEAYNNDMRGLQSRAREIATGNSTYESIADSAIKAAAFEVQAKHVLPMLGEQISEMQQVIIAQKKEIDGYRSRNPNRAITATTGTPAATTGAPKTISELAEAAWGGR